jgi:hypothetical protein
MRRRVRGSGPVRRRVRSDSPMRRLQMRSGLQMRWLPMRRGHLRHRLRRLCRLHLQLQLLHIVGILHMALLGLDTSD